MENKSLKPFIKANTLEDKVAIINDWEVDRGAVDCECIFDLKDSEDQMAFTNLYGQRAFDVRFKIGRFWMGGCNFYCDIAEKDMCCCHKVYEVSQTNIDDMLNNIISEIEDRAIDYLTANSNDAKVTADDMNGFYHNRIDFKSYFGVEKTYCWLGASTDGSYEDNSQNNFTNIKDVYLDMRDRVLDKMAWNIEFEDFNGEEDSFIRYNADFSIKEITHKSYSGFYIYRVFEVGKEKEELIDLITKAHPYLNFEGKNVVTANGKVYVCDRDRKDTLDKLDVYLLLRLYGEIQRKGKIM